VFFYFLVPISVFEEIKISAKPTTSRAFSSRSYVLPTSSHPKPVALVTGASSGIGRAIALRLSQEGYNLVICARRKERLDHLMRELESSGTDVLSHTIDLRDTEGIPELFERARERFGGIDVLINNAGLGKQAPLLSGETEAWREMLEVNVLALCICTREATADMLRRKADGHIIHISSMSAHRVPTGSGVYSATKFAVRSLTESLRQELRAIDAPIRITAISPGFVETEFAEVYSGSAELAKEVYSQYPVLQPTDIADALWYALSQPAHVQVHDILVRPTQQAS